MRKNARRRSTARIWQGLFWWSGFACLVGAIAGVFLDLPTAPIVSLGGVGLILGMISLVIEIRREGFTADPATFLFSSLALLCGVLGYFFHHIDAVWISAIGGFLVFFFCTLGAQVWGQWGDTKDLWRRWKKHRAFMKKDALEKKAALEETSE